MARWEPNARERLERAALELFLQRGYESTTVAEIAERAGLVRSTFFRHFADKREVLFGRDELKLLLLDGIAGAPDGASPIETVGAALQSAAAAFSPQRRAFVRQRQQAVAANSNLLERELLKRAGLAAAMAEALRGRGVAEPTASLAAEVASLALRTTLARWVEVEVGAEAAEAAPAGAAGSTGTEEPSAAESTESTDAADGAADGAWADPRDFGAIARDQLAALRAAGAALG
jgi:AcrR family transcriptional regulator